MKKIRLIAVTCGLFLTVAGVVITSCSKQKESPVVPANSKASKMAAQVDLEHFETTVTTAKDGTQTVVFSEPDDIDFAPEFAARLGFQALTVSKGIYTIQRDVNGMSSLTFPIMNFSGTGVNEPVKDLMGDGSGIRIARRHSYRNGCGNECSCGIGFRCGFHQVDNQGTTVLNASISIIRDDNGNPTSLKISFNNQNIDWNTFN